MDFKREYGDIMLRLRARAAAGTLLSPHIYTSGAWRRDGYQTVVQQVAAYKALGYDFIKIRDESGRELFDSLVAAAHQVGIPFAGHIVGGVGLEQVLQARQNIYRTRAGLSPLSVEGAVRS